MQQGSKDMIGRVFGCLKVEEPVRDSSTKFVCTCKCGKQVIRIGSELRRKRSKNQSCGCFPRYRSLVGSKFNDLEVIKEGRKQGTHRYWTCKCVCGGIKEISGDSLKRGRIKSCGCLSNRKKENILSKAKDRLKERAVVLENGCWEWTGAVDRDGYGITGSSFGEHRAHRASYKAYKGQIPNGKMICHNCDNPKCINPVHLYCGTAKENSKDAWGRNRFSHIDFTKRGKSGEKNGNAKLTEDQVKDVRFYGNILGISPLEINKFYRVHISTLRKILRGETWKSI